MADKIIFGLNCVNGDNSEVDIAAVCTEDNRPGLMLEGKTFTKDDLGGGGTEVVANPTLAGGESSLEGLQVGETKYKVPSGTEVTANPTLAGTEADLTGIQVGETKYKVPSGTEVVANPTGMVGAGLLTGLQVGNEKYKIDSYDDTWTAKALYERIAANEPGNSLLSDLYLNIDASAESTLQAMREIIADGQGTISEDGLYYVFPALTPAVLNNAVATRAFDQDDLYVSFLVKVEDGDVTEVTLLSSASNFTYALACYGVALVCFAGEESADIPEFTDENSYIKVVSSNVLSRIFKKS